MKPRIAETTRVVHGSEIDTPAKRGDLHLRMQRKFEGRFGRTTPYDVDERPVRLASCFRSSANAYLVTLRLIDDKPWPPPLTDGDMHNRPRVYAEMERRRHKRIQEIMDDATSRS